MPQALSEDVRFKMMGLIVCGGPYSWSWKRVENVSLIKEMAGSAFPEKCDYKKRNLF